MIKSLGSYLARDNLNKIHDFGHGNIRWGLVEILIANTHICLQY
jgi:hypothetical protein